VAAVLANIERAGIRVDPKALDAMSLAMEKEVRRLEKEIWELAGMEFNVNSPTAACGNSFRQAELAGAAIFQDTTAVERTRPRPRRIGACKFSLSKRISASCGAN